MAESIPLLEMPLNQNSRMADVCSRLASRSINFILALIMRSKAAGGGGGGGSTVSSDSGKYLEMGNKIEIMCVVVGG